MKSSESELLSSIEYILLDLNGTFMFGHDRLGPGENYYKTYQGVGGSVLEANELRAGIDALVAQLSKDYADPACIDSFPSVRSVLNRQAPSNRWPDVEREIAEKVIALHELGTIPEEYSRKITDISESLSVGVVSNLWSRKDLWVSELSRAGLGNTFETLVFSSDGQSIKPSAKIFDSIINTLHCPRSKVLMVGDSMDRDIAGAHAAGFNSMLVDGGLGIPSVEGICPNLRVRSLLDLKLD